MIKLYKEMLNELIDELDDISFEAASTGGFNNDEEASLTILLVDELKKTADKFEWV